MTDEQTLQKAIERAVEGGWNPAGDKRAKTAKTRIKHAYELLTRYSWIDDDWVEDDEIDIELSPLVIYRRDFARALFGSEFITIDMGPITVDKPAWQHHLQQMVICDDPVEYLRDYLTEHGE